MKGGTQAALALSFGYLLGRRRKLRKAAIVAGAMATGKAGVLGSTVIKRGAQALGSTDAVGRLAPEMGAITGAVRGQLAQAGKAAAVAAVSSKINSFSDSLHERAETIRGAGESGAGESGAGEFEEDRQDEYPQDEYEYDDEDRDDEYDHDPLTDDDEYAAEGLDDEYETVGSHSRDSERRRIGRSKSPVSRARR